MFVDWAHLCEGAGRVRRTSFVTAMETTDFRDRHDWSDEYLRGRPVIGRVFFEPEVRPTAVIVPDVGTENAPKMRLVQDDHVIEALSSERADHAFDVRILPGTRGRGGDFGDAHTSDAPLEHGAMDAVSIPV